MSEKLTCPGCNSHTSEIFRAISTDDPCPYCGLSARAIIEIDRVRSARADTQLIERTEELIIANSHLQRDYDDLMRRLVAIRSAVDGDWT
jgi:hypothetical protein